MAEENQPAMEYFCWCGKKIQKTVYSDYVHYLTKFGRLAFGLNKAKHPKDHWWVNDPSESPVSFRRKNIEVYNGMVKMLSLSFYRYQFQIGWLFKRSEEFSKEE